MRYVLEYSQKRGFYYSQNKTHSPSPNRKVLTNSISYEYLSEFIMLAKDNHPDMWNNKNPSFEVIKKEFKEFIL